MTKQSPYPFLVAAKLTIDVARFAPLVIDEHEWLIAAGYKLASPVTVNMRKDGTMTVPFRYRAGKASTWTRQVWSIEAYAGWVFGHGPQHNSPKAEIEL